MHEASLVASLLQQVNELVVQQGGGQVEVVRVEVGPLAGVEPLLLREAFRRLRSDSSAANAELVIDVVRLTCRCQRCRMEYETDELRFVCPICGGGEVNVTSGDSVVLHSLTLAKPAEVTP